MYFIYYTGLTLISSVFPEDLVTYVQSYGQF